MAVRVIILPGNGCTPVEDCNWYGWMQDTLQKSGVFSEVVLRDMPDPYEAKEEIWMPFIKDELKVDEHTIVIGHSSGAVAAMRLLEHTRVLGCVLVSTCHTDLGCESERISNYYSRPWQWEKIKANASWILQYHSVDDHLIPIEEADFVASNIDSTYTRFQNRSHFFRSRDVEDVSVAIIDKAQQENSV
jgi:predicted alpha/beta hydrolase family esterase